MTSEICLDQRSQRRSAHYILLHVTCGWAVFDQLAQQQAPQFGFFFRLSLIFQITSPAKHARDTRFEGLLENSPQPALVLFAGEARSIALREVLANAIGIDTLELDYLTRSSIEGDCE
jgi:hypothetical protein